MHTHNLHSLQIANDDDLNRYRDELGNALDEIVREMETGQPGRDIAGDLDTHWLLYAHEICQSRAQASQLEM
jgi:hypothetical protein